MQCRLSLSSFCLRARQKSTAAKRHPGIASGLPKFETPKRGPKRNRPVNFFPATGERFRDSATEILGSERNPGVPFGPSLFAGETEIAAKTSGSS